ncbi:threonine aldolase [Thermanaerovibrio velox DSM 12556]|uniref:Threonine aldolase n=1 Tax=Thermanaerovibrio velox DSM 12556 TaxID=926567 RepID=H0UNS2_9BACT|nr:threonine aldolase [Thermanaerovibrio velox DSM 12556]
MPMDFRSDTVTRPTPEMRRAMAEAEVGDDVYGEDPTVRRLEEECASMLGTQDALFVCSGTMGNLTAALTWCPRGTSAIVGSMSHMYNYEAGGMSALGGVFPAVVDDSSGCPALEDVKAAVRGSGNVHFSPTRLLCLENTHNSCGGVAVEIERFRSLALKAREEGLYVHLDGARLFNACVALGCEARLYGEAVTSVMICLSKGLGAPMGSVLCGPSDFIAEARGWRKRLGGGLRQSGVVAAAGLVALRSIDRLHEDHENAALLSRGLEDGGLKVHRVPNPTNMVYFSLPGSVSPGGFVRALAGKGVFVGALPDGRIRMVTHRDVSREDVLAAVPVVLKEAGLRS